MPMNPNFLCCIGAELKNSTQQTTRMSQVYLYRSFEDDTLSDMLSAGFFNAAMGIIRQDDLLLLYSPNETTAKYTYARVSSVSSSGVVIERIGIEATQVIVDTTGYSNLSGNNLQEILNNLDTTITTINNAFVKKDGSSVMTGPLKFRAGSFVGAIAGGLGDGIAIYKLKSDNTIDSEVASLTKTNGFTPGTTNAQDIGSSSLKWKDLYVARVIASVLNNGANINIPTTGGTLGLNDFSNITNSAKNISNWSSNVSNCITEIPQDIKLELAANGTLTLKAGSKVYKPNGGSVFDTYTTTSDKTMTITNNGTYVIDINDNNDLDLQNTNSVSSGNSLPASYSGLFYDTTNNIISWYNNGAAVRQKYSFPICVLTVSNGAISSIDQVFNGFGYVGSTVFALPGVKALAPNGRNSDGTLKNLQINITSVQTLTQSGTYNRHLFLTHSNALQATVNAFSYDEPTNVLKVLTDQMIYCYCGEVHMTNDKITYFDTRSAFHAVDYNDYKNTADQVNTNTANIALKQDEATALNFDNITNSVVEVPNNINLNLSSGTLTLKAGSKVTYPDGSQITLSTDETISTHSTDGEYVCVHNRSGGSTSILKSLCYAGPTAPTGFSGNAIWFDTTNNKIKNSYDSGATWSNDWSFPVGMVTSASSAYSRIDIVFQGFGYIGPAIFAIPGVKVLLPNGRNADGTLKNTVIKKTNVSYGIYTGTSPIYFGISNGTSPIYFQGDSNYYYNENSNLTNWAVGILGHCVSTSGVFSRWYQKTAFRSVDYNDTDWLAHQSKPSNTYKELVLPDSPGGDITIPADGYLTISKNATAAGQYIYFINYSTGITQGVQSSGGLNCRLTFPVSKGNVIGVRYSADGALGHFRFVYANGAKL